MFRIPSRLAAVGAAVTFVTSIGIAGAAPAQAAATCHLGDLYVAVGQENAGAGSVFIPVEFTNTSTHSCALRGFPGVSVVDIHHHEIGEEASRASFPVHTVVLKPDETAVATIRTNNESVVPTCRATSTYLQVFPPASSGAVLLPFHLKVCGTFEVKPVERA